MGGVSLRKQVFGSGVGSDCIFDLRDLVAEGFSQRWVIVTDFIEVAAWVVLRPELIGEAICEVFKSGETRIDLNGFGYQSSQVVDFSEFPALGNQVALQKPLGRFLKEFNDRFSGSFERMEPVCRMQTRSGGSQPVFGVVFAGFQIRLSPQLKISS